MSRLDLLRSYASSIDEIILRVLDEFHQEMTNVPRSDISQWAFEVIRAYALRPGKRLRGALAAMLYDETQQEKSEAGLYLAAALELMHDYLLVVDDVMDKSPLRRGQPTVHEMYKRRFGGADFTADMVAINIGLLLQHISIWTLAKARNLTDLNQDQLQMIANRHLAITVLGQMDDITDSVYQQMTVDAIIEKYQKKSSYYSFVNPLSAALSLAGAYDDEAQQQVEAFGLPAGVAFQLRDDWLGIFGDTKESGKANLDDIHEGKNTFLVQSALAAVDETDRVKLRHILGNEQANEADVQTVRRILSESGAVIASEHAMQREAAKAIRAAQNALCWSEDFAELLAEIVRYSVERTT